MLPRMPGLRWKRGEAPVAVEGNADLAETRITMAGPRVRWFQVGIAERARNTSEGPTGPLVGPEGGSEAVPAWEPGDCARSMSGSSRRPRCNATTRFPPGRSAGPRVVFPTVGSEQATTRLAGAALQDYNRLGMGPFHLPDEAFGPVVAISLAVNSLPVLPNAMGG